MLLRCWLLSSFVDLFGFEVGGKDFEKAKTKEICVGVLAVVCFYFIHTFCSCFHQIRSLLVVIS